MASHFVICRIALVVRERSGKNACARKGAASNWRPSRAYIASLDQPSHSQPIDPIDIPAEVDPFALSDDRHGWRGLSVPGHRKRKWWTLLHNEQVLVTALLLIPGERSVRHSHETGELSIHYDAALHPVVLWHPPGELHPTVSSPASQQAGADEMKSLAQHAAQTTTDAPMAELLMRLIADQRELRQKLDRLARSAVQPSIIVDVLFPPFKTTIDDPAYPNQQTIVGQWYD